MAGDWRTNDWFVRGLANGTWSGWNKLYHTGNFTPNATAQNNIAAAGTWGNFKLAGTNNASWSGFQFNSGVGSDIRYFMTNGGQTGEHDSSTGWQWRWDNGTLAVGTVPWARISGVPSFPYLPTAGGGMSGMFNTVANTAAFNSANDTTLSVRGSTTAGAIMSFHRAGAYAINVGLDTDNYFKIGGWSAGSAVFQLNMSGQLWLSNYGWLHDYFFNTVANCAEGYGMGATVVSNCGDLRIGARTELVDEGGQLRLRTNEWRGNCNCNCNCRC
jgi:hypothetical protein